MTVRQNSQVFFYYPTVLHARLLFPPFHAQEGLVVGEFYLFVLSDSAGLSSRKEGCLVFRGAGSPPGWVHKAGGLSREDGPEQSQKQTGAIAARQITRLKMEKVGDFGGAGVGK